MQTSSDTIVKGTSDTMDKDGSNARCGMKEGYSKGLCTKNKGMFRQVSSLMLLVFDRPVVAPFNSLIIVKAYPATQQIG